MYSHSFFDKDEAINQYLNDEMKTLISEDNKAKYEQDPQVTLKYLK